MGLSEAIAKLEKLSASNGPWTAKEVADILIAALKDIETRLPPAGNATA
jgi:hypothetical protein